MRSKCGRKFNLLKTIGRYILSGVMSRSKEEKRVTDYDEKFTNQFRPIVFVLLATLGNTENSAMYRMHLWVSSNGICVQIEFESLVPGP